MFILSTGETREPSKEIGKLEGLLEREICRSRVFKELNFTRLRRPHPEILSRSARIESEILRREAILEVKEGAELKLSLIHISEPTRLLSISYAVFCLKKKKKNKQKNTISQ